MNITIDDLQRRGAVLPIPITPTMSMNAANCGMKIIPDTRVEAQRLAAIGLLQLQASRRFASDLVPEHRDNKIHRVRSLSWRSVEGRDKLFSLFLAVVRVDCLV